MDVVKIEVPKTVNKQIAKAMEEETARMKQLKEGDKRFKENKKKGKDGKNPDESSSSSDSDED